MTNNDQYIEYLISKSITGNLNEEERLHLKKWIDESEENAREYKAYQGLWNKSKKLVFSDSIDVESSLTKTKNRISFNDKKRWLVGIRQIAAILILSVTINILYNYITSSESAKTVYQDISTAYGTQTSFILADGTKVWLNSGSHLHFPVSFSNMNERKIELDGEAFFEVAKNKDKPFIVNAKELNVKVTGTSFNVSAYNDAPDIVVALKEGKVSLLRSNSQNNEIVSLVPMEVASYNRIQNKLNLRKENYFDKYTAWKEGHIVFFSDQIETVVQKLEKWYDVDIEIADENLKKLIFTGTFINEPLEQVLSLLSISTPTFKYAIIPAFMNIDGSYTKRKIILTEQND